MSYNIDTFKLKKLHLILPNDFSIQSFEKEHRKLGFCDRFEVNGSEWTFNDDGEGLSMSGDIAKSGEFIVRLLDCSGEFSGIDYETLLKPLVKLYGAIHCVTVWEGGDSICDLKINEGKAVEKEIEL